MGTSSNSYESDIQSLEDLVRIQKHIIVKTFHLIQIRQNEDLISNNDSQIEAKTNALGNSNLTPYERQQLTMEISRLQGEKRTFENLNNKYRSDIGMKGQDTF